MLNTTTLRNKHERLIFLLKELEQQSNEIRELFPEPTKENYNDPKWQTFDQATNILLALEDNFKKYS